MILFNRNLIYSNNLIVIVCLDWPNEYSPLNNPIMFYASSSKIFMWVSCWYLKRWPSLEITIEVSVAWNVGQAAHYTEQEKWWLVDSCFICFILQHPIKLGTNIYTRDIMTERKPFTRSPAVSLIFIFAPGITKPLPIDSE